MAEPITWRNIGGPNFGGVAQQGNTAVQTLNQGFNALGGTVSKLQEAAALQAQKERELNTAKLIQEMQGASTIDQFNANKGNFDIGKLQQQYGPQGIDAEALLRAQAALPQSIMQRQKLTGELAEDQLKTEAAPLLANLQMEAAKATTPAQLAALDAKAASSSNPLVQAGWAAARNAAEAEQADLTTQQLGDTQAKQRITAENKAVADQRNVQNSLTKLQSEVASGNISASDAEQEALRLAASNPSLQGQIGQFVAAQRNVEETRKTFGDVGAAKADLINMRTTEANNAFIRPASKVLEGLSKEAKRYEYLDNAVQLSANTDMGEVARKLVLARPDAKSGLEVDDALNNVMGGYNAWIAEDPETRKNIPLSVVSAALSNITASEDSMWSDIANADTIKDRLTEMVPAALADMQEYEGIKAEQARIAERQMGHELKVNSVLSKARDEQAVWLNSPEGRSADSTKRNDWISKQADKTADELAKVATSVDLNTGSRSVKKEARIQETSLSNVTKELTSLENKLAQELEKVKDVKSGSTDLLNSFGGPAVNTDANKQKSQLRINALDQKRIELLNKQAEQEQLLKELQRKAK